MRGFWMAVSRSVVWISEMLTRKVEGVLWLKGTGVVRLGFWAEVLKRVVA